MKRTIYVSMYEEFGMSYYRRDIVISYDFFKAMRRTNAFRKSLSETDRLNSYVSIVGYEIDNPTGDESTDYRNAMELREVTNNWETEFCLCYDSKDETYPRLRLRPPAQYCYGVGINDYFKEYDVNEMQNVFSFYNLPTEEIPELLEIA